MGEDTSTLWCGTLCTTVLLLDDHDRAAWNLLLLVIHLLLLAAC